MDFPAARQQLYRLTRQNPTFNLAEAALYIAQEAYPQINIATYLKQLDAIATDIRPHLPAEPYPLKMIQVINHHLYDKLGFAGNTAQYYDPRNSFLNEVLDRRTGIPITLSLVYLEVANRLNLPMVGINFPGHFLIRPVQEGMDIYVDAFHSGEVLFRQDCQQRLELLYQQSVALQSQFFQTVEPHQFLVRLLTNLKHIYLNQGDLALSLAASERILLIVPENTREQRDRGLLYYQLGRWAAARQDLEDYLQAFPAAQDQPFITQLLQRISHDR